MSEITEAIEAKQTQITRLESDIETLQRAASIVGKKRTPAKATSQSKAKTKSKPKRPTWSAADKKAISRRMKAYWAKRKRRAQKG